MAKRITDEDLELLGELGVESASPAPDARSARQQRIVAGFEEIERFVVEQGRLPQHGEERDIFERLYAVRLDRMRELPECREALASLDARGLLVVGDEQGVVADGDLSELSDEELLASLGVEAAPESDVTRLVHVRSRDEIKAAEEVAQRDICPDFDSFKPLFAEVKHDLKSGARQSVKYKDNAEIRQGDWFIVEGQTAIVAEMGDPFVSDYGRFDSRLRVIYDNATQNELLLRSLQRALNRDKGSRRIVAPDGQGNLPLFEDETNATPDEPSETASGTIYVLRSQSDHPFIAEHRSIIHKIGVTGGNVQTRIAGAKQDPTFLLADVELVATFHLKNINRQKLEALLHKFLGVARLDMELEDRFKTPVKPKEWFFVPLHIIEQIIDKINDGTLDGFRYDVAIASLVVL